MTDKQREMIRAKIEAYEARIGPPPAIPRAARTARQDAEDGALYVRLPIKGRPRLIDATDKEIRKAAELRELSNRPRLPQGKVKKLTPEKIEARIDEEAAKMRAERDDGIARREQIATRITEVGTKVPGQIADLRERLGEKR